METKISKMIVQQAIREDWITNLTAQEARNHIISILRTKNIYKSQHNKMTTLIMDEIDSYYY